MIIVLTTCYNAQDYIGKCIASLRLQSHAQWRCFIMDDLSTDKSIETAEKYIGMDSRFEIIRNTEKRYQPGNYWHTLQRPEIEDNDICITVDGDDWLPDARVFQRVVDAYRPETWITWGSFITMAHGKTRPGCSKPVLDVTKVRSQPWRTSHLRTFRAFLYRAIKREDLLAPTGNFWETTGDLSFMYPMLEMAGNDHAKFLESINYVYNYGNPLCDAHVHGQQQQAYEKLIRAKPTYELYEKQAAG